MSDFSKGIARELILGDFNKGESTWTGTIGNVAIGFIPIVGQVADLRDTIAALNDVKNNYKDGAAWVGLGLSVLAWIPLLDALKIMKKGAKEVVSNKKLAKALKETGEKTRPKLTKKVSDKPAKIKKTRKKGSLKKWKKKLTRTIWEDRKTFNASRDFYKRHKWLFGEKHHGWSLEHSLIKRRFYHSDSKDPKKWHVIMRAFPPGTKVNKYLQKFGDAGWNQVPIPMRFNKWLDDHKLISFFFNIGSYAAAFGFIYGSIQFGHMIGTKVDQMIYGKGTTIDGTKYSKKITLD